MIVFSEIIQAVLSARKDLANEFLKALLKNFDILIHQAWEVTRLYAEMDNQIQKEPLMSKQRKEVLRVKYDKQ